MVPAVVPLVAVMVVMEDGTEAGGLSGTGGKGELLNNIICVTSSRKVMKMTIKSCSCTSAQIVLCVIIFEACKLF